MIEFGLAFVAGALTLLNPCVLPLLPIVLGSALQADSRGPLALAAGLVLSFSVFGFLVLTVGYSVGIDSEHLRMAGAVLMLFLGVVLLVPPFSAFLTRLLTPLGSGASRVLAGISGTSLVGQFLVGVLLGLVWAPCVGPTLGVAIASASQGRNLAEAFTIFAFFGLGISMVLLGLAYAWRSGFGSRRSVLGNAARWAKPLFGTILIVVAFMIVTGADRHLEARLVVAMPNWLIDWTTSF